MSPRWTTRFSAKDRLSGRYFIDHFDNAAIYDDDNLLTYRGGSNQSRVRTQNAVADLDADVQRPRC